MQSKTVHNQPIKNTTSAFTRFWENAKAIAGPYWYPTEPGGRVFPDVIRAWGMLIILILLIIMLVGVTAFNSFVSRYLLDIITEQKNLNEFTYKFINFY